MRTFNPLWLVALILSLGVAAQVGAQDEAPAEPVKKDVPYVPTPQPVVDRMLEMANVTKNDVVYDLGCGDGRMVVTAAKKYGARGVGVDIDPQRIKESNENAKSAGVTDKVEFSIKNLFDMDFGEATVLTMYLLPDVNLKLRPKILSDMKPGSRVVSHSFDMDDWKPDAEDEVDSSTIYLWIVPAQVEGVTEARIKPQGGQEQQAKLNLKQNFQEVTGTVTIDGKEIEIKDGKLKGSELSFTADGKKYTATIQGKETEAKEKKRAA
ncbi:MAG TPA: methyltransferase domain-containing protein [Tepidisphaeraceae bacterium]|nr:methyltransferase domain-containing protein [Tepidisphaeraceae bacterium]